MNDKWKEQISQPQYGIVAEKDVMVPTRDGTRISVNIFRPDTPGKFPALLAMGGYGKHETNLDMPPQPLFKSAVWDGNIEAGDTSEFVSRGYIHVVGDTRGTGDSEGEFRGGFTEQEGQDSYDVIEWLAAQPWCNGNVGMIGYSYFGMSQLKAAIEQPPHLKAIFPTHIHTDGYRESYAGGMINIFLYGVWAGRHGTSGFAPKNAISEMKRTLPPEEYERRRQELLNHPDIKNYPNIYHNLLYPHKNPFFFDMLMNRFDGPYWQERSVYPYYDKINIPTHCVGKVGTGSAYWDIYNGIAAKDKKILVKPHQPEERPWREDIDEIVRWYDHWLKGNDTGMLEEPPIKYFVTGINKYRYAEEWPPKNIQYRECYLNRWEGLSFEPELYMDEPDCFLQQPLHVSSKRDRVVYLSAPFADPMECLGPAAIKFYASIDQDDGTWIVNILDVSETGAEQGCGRGYLKASRRKVDPAKSQPAVPYHPHLEDELVTPGEIYEYNISLGVMQHVFLPGHRLKLKIESLESPRDPEIQIHYHPHLCSARTTLHKIYRNRQYRSHLLLPVSPRQDGS